MKELYDKVIEAYKSGDENLLTAAARNWIEAGEENPFKPDTEESNLYFNACRAYRIWKSGGISSRVSKLRMVKFVKQIAELDLPNPYEIPKTKQPKKVKQVVTEEPVHMFGVIPEEKKETPEMKESVEEEIKEEETLSKEPNDKRGFFSKRKKR